MKRSELFTILAIALVVVLGGMLISRPKHEASDPVQVSAESFSKAFSKEETFQIQAPEQAAKDVVLPVHESGAKAAARERNLTGPGSGDSPHSDLPAIAEKNSGLTAGALPEEFVAILSRGIIPNSEQILKSSETVRNQEKDSFGQTLEVDIRNFIRVQPESRSLRYSVACGVHLCEIQMEQIDRESGDSAISIVGARLQAEPWFQSALAPVRNGLAAKDGRPYSFGYWQRL